MFRVNDNASVWRSCGETNDETLDRGRSRGPAPGHVTLGGSAGCLRRSGPADLAGERRLGRIGTGNTGGSAADDAHVFTVGSRAELVAALGGNNATNKTNATPKKIIYVDGDIDGFEAADGSLLECADLADPAYSLDAFLAAYDPATWGYVNPSGDWRWPGRAR